jgi:hypothetical protein
MTSRNTISSAASIFFGSSRLASPGNFRQA